MNKKHPYRLGVDLGGTKIETILAEARQGAARGYHLVFGIILGTGCGGGISIGGRIQTPILKHRLGDSAGVIGAAWIGK